ncbi:MAG: thiamine biosynthesis protein ThiS [Proteobacteria bacterium]|nr:MAG: thiamine biosynthesis protein ThiS [Pseudomonadota bacterium]
MKLIINGEEKQTNSNTISELLEELEIKEKVMASAVNLEVVKKKDWDKYRLKENDKVEFLQFVGGG